jgi:glycosyltransferase involved in cell wall biosynthesis
MSASLPKITVVTPSFNQGQFIEQTIASVLDQKYPNLEYIVMDGGSTDGTVDILRKYERHIDFWESAPDKGQAGAINKGFARARGEILAWLNSDDVYEPGVLAEAADLFGEWSDVDVISGRCRLWYGDGRDRLVGPSPLRTFEDFLKINANWLNGRLIIQPEAFFKRSAFDHAGGLREELHYSFDTCLWIDMAKVGCVFASVDRHWANLRMHEDQKTRDLTGGTVELARAVWMQLRENWGRVDDPFAIADDIYCALEGQITKQRKISAGLMDSTSYRLGRILTKWKFW